MTATARRSTSGAPRSCWDRRRAGDGGDHAHGRRQQDGGLALAGSASWTRASRACCATRRGPPGHASPAGGCRRAGRRPDARRTARRDDALDWSAHGQGGGRQPDVSAAHLARPRPGPAPDPHLQAVQRPQVRRQGPRHRRALCRSARARRGAQRRREVARSRPWTAPSRACR